MAGTPSESPGSKLLRHALLYAPAFAVSAALFVMTARLVLSRAGGPAVPLDDAYIHFQYARSVAELHPFRYTPGAAPTPGATSLLWPLVLSPFYAIGFRGASIIWVAWALGFTGVSRLPRRRNEAPRRTAWSRPLHRDVRRRDGPRFRRQHLVRRERHGGRASSRGSSLETVRRSKPSGRSDFVTALLSAKKKKRIASSCSSRR